MRILFISSQFPNSVQPDFGIFSFSIVKEIAVQVDIKVIAPVPSLGMFKIINKVKKYETDLPIPDEEVIDGISVYHPKYFAVPGMGFFHHITMYNVLEPLINKIHDEWKIDVVNCHWLFPDGVAVQKVCNKIGIPVMLTALGCDLNRYSRLPARKRPIKHALIASDAVSVLNKQMLESCVALGVSTDNLIIIPNGVDLSKFKIMEKEELRRTLNIPVKDKIILFVGSLVVVKNVSSLIMAYKIIVQINIIIC